MKNPILDSNQKAQVQDLKAVSNLPTGGYGVVRLLHGGEEFTHRMVTLGFTPGVEVKVMQNYGHGPILVCVRDTHVALGRGEALKVWVEVL
jgi:Fe2+ transport system protein FeoA